MFKPVVIWLASLILTWGWPAGIDYREKFGSDYTWAVNWLKDNDALIAKYATRFGIPCSALKAIIFPELVRYNKVYDALEVESLKYLYVSEGKSYADFSVGYFQMKPSFAEMVEKDAAGVLKFGVLPDTEASRKERVGRLTDTEQQVNYLCGFYKICDRKFGLLKMSDTERLKLYATCYNSGYQRTYEKLMEMQRRKHFYGYNYSDISVYYYLSDLGGK